jgi:V/A-type H+-transporting ATPase subunit E
MPTLEDILQQEVTGEIGAINAEAEAKAKAIVDAAKEKAEAMKANRQKQLEAELQAALRRAESAGELVLNQARIQARGQVVDQVKAGAVQELSRISSQGNYAQVLSRLAGEALGGLGKAEAIVVNPGDAAHLKSWAEGQGLKLLTDASVSQGVRLIAEGGKSMVQNSLSERLERAWEMLSAKAAKAIWG